MRKDKYILEIRKELSKLIKNTDDVSYIISLIPEKFQNGTEILNANPKLDLQLAINLKITLDVAKELRNEIITILSNLKK